LVMPRHLLCGIISQQDHEGVNEKIFTLRGVNQKKIHVTKTFSNFYGDGENTVLLETGSRR
jgi:hypothetical protein